MDKPTGTNIDIAKSAIVATKAEIGPGTIVGPGAIIEDKVRIGSNVRIGAFTIIQGRTTIGDDCHIYHHAVLGTPPQDLKYKGEDTELHIGHKTIIREFTTINIGTETGHGKTMVGNNNFLMAYSHVAHDCMLGDNVIMANAATLAGHIEVHDNAIIGGLSAVHQFVRIGMYAFIGGCSAVSQDVLPFSRVAGNHAVTYSINSIGLQRAGFSHETILVLKKAFRLIFTSKMTRQEALQSIEKQYGHLEEIIHLLDFIRSSQRGICKRAR